MRGNLVRKPIKICCTITTEYEPNNYKVKASGTNNYKCLMYYKNKH